MERTSESLGKTRFLVLEPQNKTALLQELYEASEMPTWLYLFSDTDWQSYVKESPIVLQAGQNSPEYRWALKALKENRLSGLILESSQGIDAVVIWLRARLTVSIDGHRRGLLRFYDPLIWHQLAPKTNTVAHVIERVIYWHGAPGQERWMTTENPEPVSMSPVPTLDEDQRSALQIAND